MMTKLSRMLSSSSSLKYSENTCGGSGAGRVRAEGGMGSGRVRAEDGWGGGAECALRARGWAAAP